MILKLKYNNLIMPNKYNLKELIVHLHATNPFKYHFSQNFTEFTVCRAVNSINVQNYQL
jgi:hypothetical protein